MLRLHLFKPGAASKYPHQSGQEEGQAQHQNRNTHTLRSMRKRTFGIPLGKVLVLVEVIVGEDCSTQ